MAHGKNANHHGYDREYWSRRAGIQQWGTIGKHITHEKERMESKKIVQNEIRNLDDDVNGIK